MVVVLDQAANKGNLRGILDARDLNHLHVDFGVEILVHV